MTRRCRVLLTYVRKAVSRQFALARSRTSSPAATHLIGGLTLGVRQTGVLPADRRAHQSAHLSLIWNEHQLRRLLDEYVEHYNSQRPHRSLNQRPPNTAVVEVAEPVPIGKIRRRAILGGPLNENHSSAA